MNDLLGLSLVEIKEKIRRKEVSSLEVTHACLTRIDETEPNLNAYVKLTPEVAIQAAKHADSALGQGHSLGPLHGVPVSIKDLFDMEGYPTTGSSKVRENWLRHEDSAVVQKLKQAGAVIVGKTQTHEFAFGGMTPQSRNPWDLSRTPGGSSGGSAASVSSSGVYMALGTDTAGSVRIPSSMCGTVGLKPTFGRVSRQGTTSLSWQLDHIGPITRSVADAALSLQSIAGFDPQDPGSLRQPLPDLSSSLNNGIKGLRIGVPSNYFFDRVDPEVAEKTHNVYKELELLGATLVNVNIPMPEAIVPTLFLTVMPEACAYHRKLLNTKSELYTENVRTLLEAGSLLPAVDYIHAQRIRELFKQQLKEVYSKIDVLITPTEPKTADIAGRNFVTWPDNHIEPLENTYVRFTALANITGLPALSLPCGLSSDNLPIGVQIIGRPLDEATVLQVGMAWESVSGWTGNKPPL